MNRNELPVFITQIIYVKEGQQSVFHEFEDVAIPAISKYNGQVFLRLIPREEEVNARTIDHPYEIHIVKFESEKDFQNFLEDDDRQKFLHLKEQSIKSVISIKGRML